MRIGIDASRANLEQRTGTEWYAFALTRALFAHLRPTDVVRLYVREPLRPEWGSLPSNVQVRVLRWPPGFLWTQLRLSWELLIHRVDILFVPAHTIPFLAPRRTLTTLHDIGFEHERSLYGASALGPTPVSRRVLNVVVRLCTLGRYGASELDYHKFSARLAIRHCQSILTVSEYSKQDICQTYGLEPARVHVIPNACNAQAFNERVRDDASGMRAALERVGVHSPYLMTIGRVERKKNTLGLVRAFALLRKQPKYRNLQLLLVGKPGYGATEVQSYIDANADLRESVVRPGWVEERDIPFLMAGAVVFVLPSFFEGFGIPVLEAMAVGTPVVCSHVTALPEVVGDAGILTDPHNPDAIAHAVQSILDDPALQQQLRVRGLARARTFSWERSAERLAQLMYAL